MGRLAPSMSLFPVWDERCRLGSKFSSKLGHDVMLVFDAHAVDVAIGLSGGALYSSRDGVITASVTIPCAETLSQVIVMGQPRHLRPANNLVIYDARFKSLEITAMAAEMCRRLSPPQQSS